MWFEVKKVIWPWSRNMVTIYELSEVLSISKLLQGLKVADMFIWPVTETVAVCALSFQVLIHSKASQVPALLVRWHLLNINLLWLTGKQSPFCLAIQLFGDYTDKSKRHCAKPWDPPTNCFNSRTKTKCLTSSTSLYRTSSFNLLMNKLNK